MTSLARTERPGRATAKRMEIVERRGGSFAPAEGGDRRGALPDGAYNFVRVQGGAPNRSRFVISAGLAHADLAEGRPVVYAGTVRFEQGRVAWWSNYSGTYQPIAAFRERAKLPQDRFVPWQKLQLGGLAQQRTLQRDLRPVSLPETGRKADASETAEPERGAAPAKPKPEAGDGAGAAAQPKRAFPGRSGRPAAPPALVWPASRRPAS